MEGINLKLQMQGNGANWEDVFIGESKFTDDIWDLRPFVPAKTIQDAHKVIRFGYIESLDMKVTVKKYAYYELGKVKPRTVKNKINGCLPLFIEYCRLNGIDSFCGITRDAVLNYSKWLKNEKKATIGYGFNCAQVVEEIIRVGQIKGWNVAGGNIFLGIAAKDLWNIRDYNRKNKVKPIPEDVFDKILQHAVKDEKDILTKAGIIIQSQTGIRIGEVLSIREGCIKKTRDGDYYMECLINKTEKGEPVLHKVFINELVVNVVRELSKDTEQLRKESGLQELFLIKNHGIRVLNVNKWTSKRLLHFIERWDIRDSKGDLYPLKSHQFRATFVRELIKRKIPIEQIMKQYSHVSIEMTAYYLTLTQEEVRDIYSDMILSPDSKISGLRAKEIKGELDKLFCGKTEEEIDNVISNLASTISFNPLPTGVCLYDFRRGNCADGDGCFFYNCPNYITEIRFYSILKKELNLMERQMARLKEIGKEREWQREYVKYKYLKPLVESLEVQANGDAD